MSRSFTQDCPEPLLPFPTLDDPDFDEKTRIASIVYDVQCGRDPFDPAHGIDREAFRRQQRAISLRLSRTVDFPDPLFPHARLHDEDFLSTTHLTAIAYEIQIGMDPFDPEHGADMDAFCEELRAIRDEDRRRSGGYPYHDRSEELFPEQVAALRALPSEVDHA